MSSPVPGRAPASGRAPADTVTVRGGVAVPVLAAGTFGVAPGRTRAVVTAALAAGFRHVDTASIYRNESEVGAAVRAAGLAGETFVTTKLWTSDQGYRPALAAFEASRRRLGVDVVDLFLVHWPQPGVRAETWRALEELLAGGRVRAIGTSNYLARHLEELLAGAAHPPAVNQIELTPFNYRSRAETVALCREAGIQVQAFSPLGQGKLLRDPGVTAVARRHGCSPAQVLIRWALQRDLVPVVRATDPAHLRADADVFDVALSDDDLAELESLDRGMVANPAWDPTTVP